MNKRICKKLHKRLNCFHYRDAKLRALIRSIKNIHPDAELVVLETSKTGRCINKVYIGINVYPASIQ
jgi:hypothetical protein